MRTTLVMLGLSGLLGACGDNAGAILVLSAPDGPATAATIEIVLANAADDTIARGIDQRLDASSLEEAPVTYYRQRATGGSAMEVEVLDGFSVQIEPELAVAADDAFIPFLLVRDARGEVIAVGTVDDEDGSPFAIDVTTNKRVEYTTTVRPLANPAARHGLQAVGRTIACGGSSGDEFTSGIVWQPERGPQLRLLLAEPGTADASDRALDLDCDQVAADAPQRDCNDVDAGTHSGAAEACDGIDADCDGVEPRVVQCDLAQPTRCDAIGAVSTTTGVQTCDTEGGGPQLSACVAGPECVCPAGNCVGRRCVLTLETNDGGDFTTCSPAVGSLQLCNGLPCTVTVEEVDPDLELTIASSSVGPYGTQATGEKVYLHLDDRISSRSAAPGVEVRPLGSAILSLDDPTSGTVRAYVVRFQANSDLGCTPAPSGDGDFVMVCEP